MSGQLDKPEFVLAATATGTAGVIIFALLPVLLGQLAVAHSLTDTQTGLAASAYFVIYAIVSLTAPLWIRRASWRRLTLAGITVMIIGLVLLQQSASLAAVSTAMTVTGAGAAVLLPISLTLVSDMRNTERAYGITVSAQQLVPALLLLGLAEYWSDSYELENTIYLIGAIVLLCLVLSYALPAGGAVPATQAGSTAASGQDAVISLVGLMLSFAGFAAMWAFFERIAADGGLESTFTARWIAVGLFMTALGALISAALGDRIGRTLPLLVPGFAAIVSVLALAGEVTPTLYAAVLTVFPLAYYIMLSYVLSVIADADHNGRVASLMSFALACGALLGPGIFGVLRDSSPGVALWFIAIALGSGIAIILWVHKQHTARS